MLVITYRRDGRAHASIVNGGVVAHPTSGSPVVGFVVQGRTQAKLANLRRRREATVVIRSGWDWVAIDGDAELFGPEADGSIPWPEASAVFHTIYAEAIGGLPDDWTSADGAVEIDGHVAVLVSPTRVYGVDRRA